MHNGAKGRSYRCPLMINRLFIILQSETKQKFASIQFGQLSLQMCEDFQQYGVKNTSLGNNTLLTKITKYGTIRTVVVTRGTSASPRECDYWRVENARELNRTARDSQIDERKKLKSNEINVVCMHNTYTTNDPAVCTALVQC